MRIVDSFRGKPKRPVGAHGEQGGFDTVEDEIAHNMLKMWLIPPDWRGKKRWDLLLFILSAYSAISLPLLWAFDVAPTVEQLVSEQPPLSRLLRWSCEYRERSLPT